MNFLQEKISMGSTRVVPQVLLPADLRQSALEKRCDPPAVVVFVIALIFFITHPLSLPTPLCSVLPCMMQTRKMLTHGPKSIAQPAWQLLYKKGITYANALPLLHLFCITHCPVRDACDNLSRYTEGADGHDPGETGVYKKDFKKAEVFAAPSVPNIRSNDSTIQVREQRGAVGGGGGGDHACCIFLTLVRWADQDE